MTLEEATSVVNNFNIVFLNKRYVEIRDSPSKNYKERQIVGTAFIINRKNSFLPAVKLYDLEGYHNIRPGFVKYPIDQIETEQLKGIGMSKFNTIPEMLVQCTEEKYMDIIFNFQSEEKELRQIFSPKRFDLVMYSIKNKWGFSIGVAIKKEQNGTYSYCSFGKEEDMESFLSRFNLQFEKNNT